MKTKIAFVTKKLITGGVEKALISLLKKFDSEKYEVDLYLMYEGGELYEEIPEYINVSLLKSPGLKDVLSSPIAVLKKLKNVCKIKYTNISFLEENKLISDIYFPIKKEYDIAVSYHAPNTIPVFYVVDKMNARKKILWLHGDMKNNSGETQLLKNYHDRFDCICAVSKNIYDEFLLLHPNKKNKITIFYNYVDKSNIVKKSNIGPLYTDEFSGIKILTIGRLDKQKGYELAIRACSILQKNNYNIKWYVCGEGDERKKLESLIKKFNLSSSFILLGNQTNPYGYLKHCDLYVQTSLHEGYCTTTNEARILCKPVITTNVSGADEQFIDGVTGWIVNKDYNEIANKIMEVIDNKNEKRKIILNLSNLEYDNCDLFNTVFKRARW